MANHQLKRTIGKTFLVRETPREQVTTGGIHIPATAAKGEYALFGVVLAKGPDTTDDVQVGDTIIFDRFTRTHTLDGREVRIVPENEVFCVVSDD